MNRTHPARPGVKIVRDRYIGRSFRDNEPVIRDEADEWMIHLNDNSEYSDRSYSRPAYDE